MTGAVDLHVAWSQDLPPDHPVVVVLHGRGADESSLAWLADELPDHVVVAAPRAPLPEGQGYAWFRIRSTGRPVAPSLDAVLDRLVPWLDDLRHRASAVALLGFSDGALLAGALLLRRAVDAAVLLGGPLPLEDVEPAPGVLRGATVLWSYGQDDDVVPRDLLERSQRWLLHASGADVAVHVEPGLAHAVSTRQVELATGFLTAALPAHGVGPARSRGPGAG